MSHSGEEAQEYEVTSEEIRRKFFGEVGKSVEGSKMEVHAAHVPSCSNVRPHLSKLDPTKQSTGERVAKSIAAKKRPRTEEAGETLNERGSNTDFDLGAAVADDHSKSNHIQSVEELIKHHQKRHQAAGTNNEASAEGAPVRWLGDSSAQNMGMQMEFEDGKITIRNIHAAFFQASSRAFVVKLPSVTCELMWKQAV